ncbi:MAG: translation initiation factor IF-2, partial [Alphaproteobacteria bacterium]
AKYAAAQAEQKQKEAEQRRQARLGTPVAKVEGVTAIVASDNNRKTLSVGDDFRNKGGKPVPKETGQKRGRNAYMDDLVQRGRTMGSRSKGGRTNRGEQNPDANRAPAEKIIRDVQVTDFITVQELASRMAEKGSDVVKKLMMMGEMVTLTQTIDADTATVIVTEFGHTVKRVSESDVEASIATEADADADLQTRPPVVTVMGHVDHGKTTLLDTIRNAHVVKGESGGITQHIGAYQVVVPGSNRKITFLDTPGHAAFTAMRARGAQVTDVVILVVAADDGVMPQTIEAIQHAKAAGVPMVVAINKMDKQGANPQRVKNELLQHEVILEDFGGTVPSVPVSGLTGMGLKELEEVVLLQADVLDLKANPNRMGEGVVVEAELDKGRGPVATVVVQRGTVKTGDIVVAGSVYGRVRTLVSDRGENLKSAGPSTPVELLGLQGVPAAGDTFVVVENERKAKEVASHREQKQREKAQASRKLSLDNLFDRMATADKMDLNIIVKGDVQGSIEAIRHTLVQLDTPQIKVNVISSGVGVVTETDVNLAMAGHAIICAFHVRADATARRIAEQHGVEIRYYEIIYNLIDDMKNAMAGLLAPEVVEEHLGRANVRAVFKIGKKTVAGCMATDGLLTRGAKARLLRDGKVIYTGTIDTLRREKDDVKEVKAGFECGIMLAKFEDVKEGDMIECFKLNEVKKTYADLEKMVADEKKLTDAKDKAAAAAAKA